jgi:uncharacterized protein
VSSAEAQLRPVAPLERVALLDVLRGFALLGVLIVNVRSAFSSGWFRPDPSLTSVDTAAALLIRVFFVGKAMTLLTFLFGLGFAMQLARAEARGQDIRRTYVRRLLVLFGLGLCHLMLWWGDVLSHYALIGFVLLACRRAQPRALLAWAAFLVLVPQLVMAWPGVMEAVRTALGQAPSPDAIREVVVAAVRGPDFGAMEAAHFHQLASYLAMIVGWYPAWVLGRFLLGYYVGVRRLFDADGAAHLPLFRRVLAWGIALGVISNAVELFLHSSRFEGRYELTTPGLLASFAVTEVALLATAAAYVGLAVLLLQRPAWRRVLLIVAPAGRMGLTVYLGQTVIATAVFYGWGLGLGGKLGTAGDLALSVAIFSLEVALAHLWLRRFRFGPVEWLWRTLAYGKRQPMRIGSAPAAGAGAPAAD